MHVKEDIEPPSLVLTEDGQATEANINPDVLDQGVLRLPPSVPSPEKSPASSQSKKYLAIGLLFLMGCLISFLFCES